MRRVKLILVALVALLAVAQFVQPDRTNPPTNPQASFETVARPPQHVAAVLGRACRDCHSNGTVWPWYSKVSPVSWIIAGDVAEGREKLNFSRWDIYGPEMSQARMKAICREMKSGEMPPWYYRPLHPEAKVSAEEAAAVCASAGM